MIYAFMVYGLWFVFGFLDQFPRHMSDGTKVLMTKMLWDRFLDQMQKIKYYRLLISVLDQLFDSSTDNMARLATRYVSNAIQTHR